MLRSGSAQRVERYEEASGTLAETVRGFGYRAAVAAPVSVGGRLWGVLAAATTSDGRRCRRGSSSGCATSPISSRRRWPTPTRYEKLAASRARVVEVGDAERRRLERNLHDGAQQRLVSVALGLSVVAAKLESDPPAARELLADGAGGSRARGSPSCASWPAASTRPSSPSAVSGPRSTPCWRARRSRSRSRSCPRSG